MKKETQQNGENKEKKAEKEKEVQFQREQKQTNSKKQKEATQYAENSNSVIIELRDIVENIKPFQQNGVSFDVMSGEDISAVLQLETITDMKRQEHKNSFTASDQIK